MRKVDVRARLISLVVACGMFSFRRLFSRVIRRPKNGNRDDKVTFLRLLSFCCILLEFIRQPYLVMPIHLG